MGKIVELIKSFINPIEPEKSLDELAVDAGIEQADLALLKKSMGGVNWDFADEVEQPKKEKKSKSLTSKEIENQAEQKHIVIEENIPDKGEER